MPFLSDLILEGGLSYAAANINEIALCSSEPGTYAQVASVALGQTPVTVAAPSDGSPNGRRVVITTTPGGTYTVSGTVTHYAILDTVNSTLLATDAVALQAIVAVSDAIQANDLPLTFLDPQ